VSSNTRLLSQVETPNRKNTMIFVDWINASQTFPGTLAEDGLDVLPSIPKVDSGFVAKIGRDENQELIDDPEWITTSRLQHRGSFESSIMLRSDGFRVDLSGNVGRLDRPDNLFNLQWDETLAKVNEFVGSHGLPPFSAGEQRMNDNVSEYDRKHGNLICWTGGTVSMIHLTENYVTGSAGNAQAFIDWIATQSKSHVKRGRAGESTVGFGSKGSSRSYLKFYIKADEMLAHAKAHGRTAAEIKADPVYQYCKENGVVRVELEARRLLLRDNQLRFIGDITMPKLEKLFRNEVDPLLTRTREDITRVDLDALDLAPGAKMTAAAYLRGEDVRASLSRATFFRYAKQLRDYGIDISTPLDNATKFTSLIKVVEISPINTAPDWYWTHQFRMTAQAANTAAEKVAA